MLEKKWITCVDKIRRLISKGRRCLSEAAYEAALLIKKEGFLEACRKGDEDAEQLLTNVIHDVGLTIGEAASILDYFPNKTQWLEGDLVQMKFQAHQNDLEKLRALKQQESKTKIKRHVISHREFEQAQRKAQLKIRDAKQKAVADKKLLQAKIAELQQRLTDKDRIIKEKDAEIKRLTKIINGLTGSKSKRRPA